MTGLQPDGSYIPCPECRYEPPVYDLPGEPIRMPGTTHRSDCPKVSLIMDPEAAAKLRADLDAIRENHRRAWRDMQGVGPLG